MVQHIQISVVIPTCNRRERLYGLLENLNRVSYHFEEVIIIDSGDDKLLPSQYTSFTNLKIQYILSERSVCIQRNTGIRTARSPWIFLCDDDIEMPVDYFDILVRHINTYPEAGAVSGAWLQKENDDWAASYPIKSSRSLLMKYVFQLGIWGEIHSDSKDPWIKRIEQYYLRKGNHISKAGWPVNTDFSGDFIACPVYSLGASLVKKEWLLHSPYDEVLDRNGIGDNYGVIAGFPFANVHVVNKTFVYHHREPTNRLKSSLQYYRRVLALDYFIKTKQELKNIKRYRLVWSLIGNGLSFLYAGETTMVKATVNSLVKILFNQNPYLVAAKENKKITEPMI